LRFELAVSRGSQFDLFLNVIVPADGLRLFK